MATCGHLLQLKPPGALSLSAVSRTRPTQCNSRMRMRLGPISASQLEGGARLRRGDSPFGGGFERREGLGFRRVAVAASRGAVVEEGHRDEVKPEENNSFPGAGDPLKLFLYAAGFCLIVLMRDGIVQEIATWGIFFARLITNVVAGPLSWVITAAEPLEEAVVDWVLMAVGPVEAVVSWVKMAADDIFTLILEGAPVRSLLPSLSLALAVHSIGDVAAPMVKGSRSRLAGIAAALGLAGLLGFISLDSVLRSVALLTAFAALIQKADLVTVFLPVTVALITVSEPVIQAAAFGIFLAVSVYANWRTAQQQPTGDSIEQTSSEKRESTASFGRPSLVFLAITAWICISLAVEFLCDFWIVKWLLLRSAPQTLFT